MNRMTLLLPAAAIIVAGLLSSVFIVDERTKALVLQFGQITSVKDEPGLYFKIPLIQEIVRYDDRILGRDIEPLEVTPSDDRRLVVDAFARWRITDLVQFRQAVGAGGEETARLFFTGIADPVVRIVVAWVAVFVVVLVLMSIVRLAMRGLLKALGLSLSDRLLGILFGAARGLMIVLALVAVGGMMSMAREKWWSEAYFSAPLETAVLASKPWLPPEVAKRIRFR